VTKKYRLQSGNISLADDARFRLIGSDTIKGTGGGTSMATDPGTLIERVQRDPEFQALVAKRSRFVWSLTAAMVAIYFGFILLIAFNPALMAQPLDGSIITLGIPLGLGVILTAFVLTGIYVWRANSEFDAMARDVIERAKQ
jgi:uncharacterized membrane protein (DUF485 family)